MRRNRPDLLVVLTVLLGLAVLLTTYGGRLLEELDVEAQPSYKTLLENSD